MEVLCIVIDLIFIEMINSKVDHKNTRIRSVIRMMMELDLEKWWSGRTKTIG